MTGDSVYCLVPRGLAQAATWCPNDWRERALPGLPRHSEGHSVHTRDTSGHPHNCILRLTWYGVAPCTPPCEGDLTPQSWSPRPPLGWDRVEGDMQTGQGPPLEEQPR